MKDNLKADAPDNIKTDASNNLTNNSSGNLPISPAPKTHLTYGNSYDIPDEVISIQIKNPLLSKIILTKIGCFKKAKGHGIIRSGINENIIIYCIEGKGSTFSGGIQKPVHQGDIVLLQKNQPHAYHSDDNEPWTILWAHFDGEAVPELFNLLDATEFDFIKKIGILPEAISLLQNAYEALATGYSFPNLFHSTTLLQEFFSLVIKIKFNAELSIVTNSNEKSNSLEIKNIINYMVQHIYDNLSLEEFCSFISLSKYHFSRLFKLKTGYSPMEYYNRLKIQRACELLDTSSLSVKEISIMLSFNNPYYFSEVFKRIVGCSPKSYKKQNHY